MLLRARRRIAETTQREEAVHHCRRLVAAAHHAVGALRIAAGGAVAFPVCRLHQLLEGLRIAILQQVARLLPAEDVIRRRTPGRALILLSPIRNSRNSGDILNFHDFLRFDKIAGTACARARGPGSASGPAPCRSCSPAKARCLPRPSPSLRQSMRARCSDRCRRRRLRSWSRGSRA